jgi:hypothetical protein
MQLGLGDRSGTHYTVKTQDAAGLVEGNSVRIAGVEVGKVEQIHVEGNVAVIDIRVRPGTNVWADACAAVHIKGMLGEKYLGISQAMEGTPMPAKSTFGCVTATVDFDNALNATKEMVYGEDSLLPPITRVAHRIDRLTASLDEGPGLPREKLDKMLDDTQASCSTTRATCSSREPRGPARHRRGRQHDAARPADLPHAHQHRQAARHAQAARSPTCSPRATSLLPASTRPASCSATTTSPSSTASSANGDTALANLSKISGDFKDIGKELKPALVKVGPLLKNLATIAERGAAITYDDIRRMLQVEGMRVRIVKNRKAEREIGEDRTRPRASRARSRPAPQA